MKKLATILTFLLISLNGICDTIDYWHVYINDSLVAKFDQNSKDLTIKIKGNQIKSNDTITVRYGKDTRCIDCYYGLTVLLEIESKSPVTETKEYFGKLSISLKSLFDIGKANKISKFPFNYYERINNEKENNGRLLFVLTII